MWGEHGASSNVSGENRNSNVCVGNIFVYVNGFRASKSDASLHYNSPGQSENINFVVRIRSVEPWNSFSAPSPLSPDLSIKIAANRIIVSYIVACCRR